MKLCVTHCAGKKHDGILPPDKLYISRRIERFIAYCKQNNLNWAILSAKYGLFFPEEERGPYDVTLTSKSRSRYWLGIQIKEDCKGLPRDESDRRLKELAETVAAQINQRSITEIVYYYEEQGFRNPPKGYLAMLHYICDKCEGVHSWAELLECAQRHGRVQVSTQLNFDP
jgi:hypothetical protein